MNKPAYLVEGDLEQKFIQSICPGCPVRKINCNGESVNLKAITSRVGSLARLLHKQHSPIIVVFDRESRDQTSEDIEHMFSNLITTENIQVPVIVGVPDRNIETWILADYRRFAKSAKIEEMLPNSSFEGKNGKTAIKQALGNGNGYVETIDGVEWLKAARPRVMRENSPSFRRFAALLPDLTCWWMQQQELDMDNK